MSPEETQQLINYWAGIATIASAIATIVGVIITAGGFVIAFGLYFKERHRERITREAETYFKSNEKYIQYLMLCLEHPEANAFDPDTSDIGVDVKRRILLSILISTFETAFLQFRSLPYPMKEAQWSGWESYIKTWTKDSDFQKIWRKIGSDFDSNFVQFMNEFIPPITSDEP